jgi:hypothetical protein
MESVTGEPPFQLLPRFRLEELAPGRRPDQLVERQMSGAFPLPELPRRESIGSLGRVLPRQLVMVPGHFPQPELPLLPA